MTNKGSGALGPPRRTITVLSGGAAAHPAWPGTEAPVAARSSPNPFTSVIRLSQHQCSPPQRWASMLLKCVHLFILAIFKNSLQAHFAAGLFGLETIAIH